MADPLEDIVRAAIFRALEDCPAIIPQDRRYADAGGQRAAKDQVAHRIARELSASGLLPFDASNVRALSNYQAVSYTMGQMRARLLRHIRGGGGDIEAQRDALASIAIAFFSDLEERGWRLVRTRLPAEHHSTQHGALR
jgi:hypothetical protein